MSTHEPDPVRNSGVASRPLSKLRERLQDDARRGSGAGFGERLRMETESALEWDRASGGGQGYPEDLFETGKQFAEGNEHRIFQNDDGSRAIKLTRPPNFGARGSLLEYLDNLVLNNYLSGDDLRIEGVSTRTLVLNSSSANPGSKARRPLRSRFGIFSRNRVSSLPGKTRGTRQSRESGSWTPALPIFSRTRKQGLLMPVDIHIHAPLEIFEKAWACQKQRERNIES